MLTRSIPLVMSSCLVFALLFPVSAWADGDLYAQTQQQPQQQPEQEPPPEEQPQEQPPEEPTPQEKPPQEQPQEQPEEQTQEDEQILEDVPVEGRTILNYSLSGGAIGAIVGTGLWLISGRELSLWLIPQLTGAGVVIGAGVGTLVAFGGDIEPIAATEMYDKSNSIKWIEKDLPKTFDVQILKLDF